MKKIINQPETMVREMCNGIVLAHPELVFDSKFKIVKKKELNPSKVTLISGGGSGHEPAHAGLVGKGMLDAAVCGDIFASPSQIQVYQAIKSTAGEKGTLLVIKNYSGDMMNFKNAAHLASEDGILVDYIKVDDDIAVEDSLYTVGRRGVAGTVLVHKVLGAAAEAGCTLEEVKRVGEKAASSVRSIGFALSSCTVPAKGTPTFHLEDDEIEYGVGIHGEPGIKKEKMSSASVLAKRMVGALVKELNITEGDGSKIALLINGFGATPLQELYLLHNAVSDELLALDVTLNFVLVGNYMTSIDMAGASVSVMKLDEELCELLNTTCDTPALKVTKKFPSVSKKDRTIEEVELEGSSATSSKIASSVIKGDQLTIENMMFLIESMGDIIIENEVPFCDLDSHAGDGDFGMSVAKGFKQLRKEWNEIIQKESDTIGALLEGCSMVIMEHCGGASGPIWGSAFRAAGKKIGQKTTLSVSDMAQLLSAAVHGIQATGERSFGRGAGIGDKTLMDALIPCADAWEECTNNALTMKDAFEQGAKEAVRGAKETEKIVARMGRAGTVGERSLGYPDAGAHALGVIFTELNQRITFEA